ncbi:MAG: hypothetical protein A2W90_04600 [Bacteroidetes bacterium GWF2_42_66]|nr:MAG: hypothetical protein A2W92_10740 [Bacteroidetes bacterium GWA2_42_15]OFY00747.1 MAG: hypothetical protein A2W89_20820 [Bacteroidetes bacterium GWE2_42_39]OFY40772.1 MAG: hypothetical protein A2W90_04600 [Bacteroidetes bacterium GWF2_42_66]
MLLTSCIEKQDKNKKAEYSNSTDKENYPEWFRDAKFGMFIHWGPYSQLAGEWNGQKVPVDKEAEWIMHWFKIPVDEYRNIARKFNPIKFNAKEWVGLAKSTGMKYIVLTAKHCDGFAMYHSKVTPYNIVDWTPFKRDPMKELAQACAEEGIKLGFYYNQKMDWDHPLAFGNDWDYDNYWAGYGGDIFHQKKYSTYLEEKAKPQVQELMTNYGPIGSVWFDSGLYTPEQGQEFVDLVHSIQPSTRINSRVGNYSQELLGDYQSMSDNGLPAGGLDEYFECPGTLNKTWGYSKFDTLWKSPETVIENLVRIVSSGGNYLLNIGPKGDGEIPSATVKIFEQVGQWVSRNEESIYGTTANPFGKLEWGYCTVKGNKLYLFVRDWPQDGMLYIPRLKNKVVSAYLLLDQSKKMKVDQSENQACILLPSKPTDNPMTVIVAETNGSPQVNPMIVLQTEDGSMNLDYQKAIPHGKAMRRFNRKGGYHISKWTGPKDSVEWFIHVDKAGAFKVSVEYGAKKEWEGRRFELVVGNSTFSMPVQYTGDWFDYFKFPVGYIEHLSAGDYKVTIRPKESNDDYLMWLRSISISPVEKIKQEGWGVNEDFHK